MFYRRVAVVLMLAAISVSVPAAASAAPVTQAVSRTAAGAFGNHPSAAPGVSADGRYVAFSSHATNLVPGDTNVRQDVFVRDLTTGTIVRASLGPGGVQANAACTQARISGNGRYVTFTSSATNLATVGTGGQPNVYVRDLSTGVTTLVSIGLGGHAANADSAGASISADGRYIAFASDASNLVAGDTNGQSDVVVRDMTTGVTSLVSWTSTGGRANGFSDGASISADGNLIAFESGATNLVAHDTNGVIDVFLRDRTAGTTKRISTGPGGVQANGEVTQPTMAANGTHVAFVSQASNLVATDTDTNGDVVRRTLSSGVNVQVSFRTDDLPGSFANEPSISANGNLVAFTTSSDLVPTDTDAGQDVYVRNISAGTNELISVDLSGGGAGLDTAAPSISSQGHRVAFSSSASTLVAGDANNTQDVFARSR
ncbi:MAG TPA: hypothetical protein VGJ28_16340 [Micromonosporaceae bacterium]